MADIALSEAPASQKLHTMAGNRPLWRSEWLTRPSACTRRPTPRRAVSWRQAMYDGVTDIVLVRRALTDADQLVNDWKANGGDKMRGEYEHAGC